MSDRSLAERLHLRPRVELTALHAPANYAALLGPLPPGVAIRYALSERPAFVHLFVRSRAELARHFSELLRVLLDDTILWISYPKRTSGVASDLDRDHGFEPIGAAGWRPVSIVSVDETWSALRFRPAKASHVRSGSPEARTRRPSGRGVSR